MSLCDISINRVYWKYIQTNSYMRPLKNYYCHTTIPSLGSYVNDLFFKSNFESSTGCVAIFLSSNSEFI